MTRPARDPVITALGLAAAAIVFATTAAFVAFTVQSLGQPWPNGYGPGAVLCGALACVLAILGTRWAMRVWRDA